MKPTNLQFERNHRYGVVGNNGVGKTTLLNRIASGEINGFPQNIKVLYIQHGTQSLLFVELIHLTECITGGLKS